MTKFTLKIPHHIAESDQLSTKANWENRGDFVQRRMFFEKILSWMKLAPYVQLPWTVKNFSPEITFNIYKTKEGKKHFLRLLFQVYQFLCHISCFNQHPKVSMLWQKLFTIKIISLIKHFPVLVHLEFWKIFNPTKTFSTKKEKNDFLLYGHSQFSFTSYHFNQHIVKILSS